MVSILGDYSYTFPPKMELKYHMKDFLEKSVDEKYYISDKIIKCFTDTKNRNGLIRAKLFRPHNLKTADVAWTITTCPRGRVTDNFIIDDKRIRALTPKESFRLMGIQDTYIAKLNVSNTQAYKQAGNSIVVTVLMAVFGKMLDLDYEEKIKDMVEKEVLIDNGFVSRNRRL